MEPEQKYCINIPLDSDFSIHNIPFGVVQHQQYVFAATVIGNTVINLKKLQQHAFFQGPLFSQLSQLYLNKFMGLGRPYWKELRNTIQQLAKQGSKLCDKLKQYSCNLKEVTYKLPCKIGDYTDFYSSKAHAFNVGSIIRGPDNALQENWLHLPVGYHGRSSSVVETGTPIRRPRGQTKAPTQKIPSFSQCKRLDFEVQVGAFVGGQTNQLGHPIKVNQAWNNIFGLVLLNDWSARDMQTWEYVPLGPFTAKNLATTISPWIITLQALQIFKVQLDKQVPPPLKYLDQKQHLSFDINLQCSICVGDKCKKVVQTNFKNLYWSCTQQLTHHSVTGCNMMPGDLLGSGTISGQQKGSFGSLLQITWGGKQSFQIAQGIQRKFLQDGDKVLMRGLGQKGQIRIGFGQCDGQILPSLGQQQYY